MEEEKTAEGEIHGLGEEEILTRLGKRDYLCLTRGRCGLGHDVTCEWVGVYCVDTAARSHHRGQRYGDISRSRPDIYAAPALAKAEPSKRSGEWTTIDIVSQSQFAHLVTLFLGRACDEGHSERVVEVVSSH
jgi:hypothetical protein